MKLTDLEIRMKISLIELNKQFPKAKSIEFDKNQNCFWVDNVGFTSWPLLSPLIDDALCFKLMVKYEVNINRYFDCATIDSDYTDRPPVANESFSTDDVIINKAICLAIIEANK